jgi:hypothetical protein
LSSDEPKHLSPEADQLTAQLLSETREELTKADSKAQILLAASGVIVGVVLSGAIGGKWSPTVLVAFAEVIWWVGVGVAAFGILALGFALFPRLFGSDHSHVTYFEDVRRFATRDDLIDGLNGEAERGGRDAEQLLRLSRVVHRKYAAIQWAILALGSAAVICGLSALLG